jgi:ADP-ribose pyrophosphatase YjhB (NUDIX family)
MAIVNLNFQVTKPFGNLFRKNCVLIAVEDNDGNILIGTKPSFFPPTIARLLGGGVDEGEDLYDAAIRELYEELNVRIEKSDMTELSTFISDVTDEDNRTFHNVTTVYHVNIGKMSYRAGDDVKSILKLTKEELLQLGESYENLSSELWYMGNEGNFSWADYAKLYGPLHKIVAKELISLNNEYQSR